MSVKHPLELEMRLVDAETDLAVLCADWPHPSTEQQARQVLRTSLTVALLSRAVRNYPDPHPEIDEVLREIGR